MNTTLFEQRLQVLSDDHRELFFHRLRTCPVEEAYDILYFAGFGDSFTLAEVAAYRQARLASPEAQPADTAIAAHAAGAEAPAGQLPESPASETGPSLPPADHPPAIQSPDCPASPAPDHATECTDSSGQPAPVTANPDPVLPPEPPPIKRRGKVASLPKAIRNEVNLFLDEGKTYETIAHWLEQKGFPGFNPVNLHNWKQGGFQDWLREQERLENQQLQREWVADLARQTAPGEINQLSLQLFRAQIMNTLFGLDTTELKKGLGSNPRHYIALLNSLCRMNEHFIDSEEYQAFAKRYRERKVRKNRGLSDETLEMIFEVLHNGDAPARASASAKESAGADGRVKLI